MVKNSEDIMVMDHKTKNDITSNVLLEYSYTSAKEINFPAAVLKNLILQGHCTLELVANERDSDESGT
jgi:polyhydroxyalkanoate synthesis regulator protein